MPARAPQPIPSCRTGPQSLKRRYKTQLRFGDHDLHTLVRKRRVGTLQALQMVFQNPDSALNPQKIVVDELRWSLRLIRVVARDQKEAAIEQLWQAVGLDGGYGQRYPAQLSGGEKQRVAIARAFAGRQQFVLCDEPTSSLTVSVLAMALNLLPRLQPEYGTSLLSAVPILHPTAQRTRIRLKGNIPSPIAPPHPAAGAESAPGRPSRLSTR
jgi:ABC-type glutathione transport system ATPase component